MTKLTPVNAGIYCRISDDRAGGGLGVERQRQDCLRLAETLGWTVVDTYTDNDISAYSGKRRPQYERLLADVITGKVTGILAWHLDRVNRSPVELERLIDLLERHAVAVQTVTAGPIDLSKPTGRAVARTLGAWARYESEHKGERLRANKLQRAQQGAPNGGSNRPFGYAADKVTIVPEEARVIQQSMRRFLRGEPFGSIISDLNARGVLTTGGKEWTCHNLRQILVSGRIAGYRDQPHTAPNRNPKIAPFLVKAQWPAIVSRADVARARALYLDETVRPGSHARWPLSGIMLCGICRLPLTSTLADERRRSYICRRGGTTRADRCGKTALTALVDQHVVGELHHAIRAGLLGRILDTPTAFDTDLEVVNEADRRLARLDYERRQDSVTMPDWRVRRAHVLRFSNHHREALAAYELLDLADLSKHCRRIAQTWLRMPTRDKRALLRVATSKITVGVGVRGVSYTERVHITWRA